MRALKTGNHRKCRQRRAVGWQENARKHATEKEGGRLTWKLQGGVWPVLWQGRGPQVNPTVEGHLRGQAFRTRNAARRSLLPTAVNSGVLGVFPQRGTTPAEWGPWPRGDGALRGHSTGKEPAGSSSSSHHLQPPAQAGEWDCSLFQPAGARELPSCFLLFEGISGEAGGGQQSVHKGLTSGRTSARGQQLRGCWNQPDLVFLLLHPWVVRQPWATLHHGALGSASVTWGSKDYLLAGLSWEVNERIWEKYFS